VEASTIAAAFDSGGLCAEPQVNPVTFQDVGQASGDGRLLDPEEAGLLLKERDLGPEASVDLGQLAAHRPTPEDGHGPGTV
jgi:hypothetical protein